MINDMGWTPESIPNEGHSAMLRCAFRAAIAQFNLHEESAAAEAQRFMADAVDDQPDGSVEAGVALRGDPADASLEQLDQPDGSVEAGVALRGDPADASLEQIEVRSTSDTVLASSDSENSDAGFFEPPERSESCQVFDLSPRAPPSMDPEEIPDSKRRRPRSILKILTSPVLRQAATFAADGLFEDFEVVIFKRAGSVLFPTTEMIFMAVLLAG